MILCACVIAFNSYVITSFHFVLLLATDYCNIIIMIIIKKHTVYVKGRIFLFELHKLCLSLL